MAGEGENGARATHYALSPSPDPTPCSNGEVIQNEQHVSERAVLFLCKVIIRILNKIRLSVKLQ